VLFYCPKCSVVYACLEPTFCVRCPGERLRSLSELLATQTPALEQLGRDIMDEMEAAASAGVASIGAIRPALIRRIVARILEAKALGKL